MKLPIDVCNDRPIKFRWKQNLTTPVGDRTVEHEGPVAAPLEGALRELIELAKKQQQEIIDLRRVNVSLADRIAAQSDVLSKKAEVPARPAGESQSVGQPGTAKKIKGN